MAQVANLSDQAISIPVKGAMRSHFLTPHLHVVKNADGDAVETVDPKSEQPIPDADIRAWLKKPLNQRMIDNRQIVVNFERDVAPPIAQAKVDVSSPPAAEHWRTLVSRIATITDADELERLFIGEERQAVRKALESRMKELT